MSTAAAFPEPGSDVPGAPPPPPGFTSTHTTTNAAAADSSLAGNRPSAAVWVAGAIAGSGTAVLVYLAIGWLRRKV